MAVVWCQADSRVSGTKPCGGFVAKIPYPVQVLSIVESSSDADPTHIVVSCQSCKSLHELAPDWSPELREVA